MLKPFKIFCITCISAIVWLTVFELATTFWIRSFGDPLLNAKEVLNIDAELGWRQKSNFKGTFLDLPLSTNEAGLRSKPTTDIDWSAKKILFLGPSSTFGWGVEGKQTYASILPRLLKKTYPDAAIESINAGQIGYSSWQGIKFYKNELADLIDADLIVLAYGINDTDQFRFYFAGPQADKNEFAAPKDDTLTSWQNLLNKSNIINAATHFYGQWAGSAGCSKRFLPRRRVSDDDYAANTSALIQLAKQNGARIILLSSPFSLPSFEDVPPQADIDASLNYQMGKQAFEEGRFEDALHSFNLSVKLNKQQSDIFYYMSVSHARLGQCAESRELFERARLMESRRITRDIMRLNDILEGIAGQEGIAAIQTPSGISRTYDKELFVDPIHLSYNGHKIVAQKLKDAILQGDLLELNDDGYGQP